MILKCVLCSVASYGEVLDYLIFQHDEITKAKLYDGNGNRLLRPVYLMDGLNCTPMAFPWMAEELNREFRKNTDPKDIQMIHYIISYHPDDAEYRGLDLHRAHELSLEWARRCLPGMLGVVCTHEDGDHHAGNFHTHIILNSLKYTDEIAQSMKHPDLTRRGNRFNPRRATCLEHREILDEIAIREGLIPGYSGSFPSDRINNREYHVRYLGQKKLDEENRKIIASGGIPTRKVFLTEKQEYRIAVYDASRRSRDIAEFKRILWEEHKIRLMETDGKWRYVREGTKGYSPGTLGPAYYREVVEDRVAWNRKYPDEIARYLKEKQRQHGLELAELRADSLPGYLETLSPPYSDDLVGDICRAVNALGWEFSSKEEQVQALKPYAELVRQPYMHNRKLSELDRREKILPSLLDEWKGKRADARKARARQETLCFFRNAQRDYGPLKVELASSSDPEVFRKEHWRELSTLEAAERYLKDVPPKTPEEQREEYRQAYKAVRYARSLIQDIQEDLDWFHEIRPLMDPIRPELERAQEDRNLRRERVLEARRRCAREDASREEKHLIPPDYER